MKLVITSSEGAISKVLKVMFLHPGSDIFNVDPSLKRTIAKYFLFKKNHLKQFFFWSESGNFDPSKVTFKKMYGLGIEFTLSKREHSFQRGWVCLQPKPATRSKYSLQLFALSLFIETESRCIALIVPALTL